MNIAKKRRTKLLLPLILAFVAGRPFADVLIDDFEQGYNGTAIGTLWYFFNDSADHGKSIVRNEGPGHTFKGYYDPGKNSKYAGELQYDLTAGYEYPYVGMGFSLDNDTKKPVDLTSAAGIRFNIRADKYEVTEFTRVRVALCQANITNFDYYHEDLFIGPDWDTIEIMFSESELGREGSGDDVPLALDKIQRIDWIVQDKEKKYLDGRLWIDNVVIIGNPVGLRRPPPYPPILVYPALGANGIPASPVMSWHPSQGAGSYTLQVSTAKGFGTALFNMPNITDTVAAIQTLEFGNVYYWRVNAQSGDSVGRWSSIGNFTVTDSTPRPPTLIAPADSATSVAVSPVLSWRASAAAKTYRVQVSSSSAFSSTVIDSGGITDTSCSVSALANGITYYWRVCASNVAGAGAWSAPRGFTTITASPETPVLASPADGAVGVAVNTPLSWNVAARAANYRLQVSTSPDAASAYVINQPGLTATAFSGAAFAKQTRYYWRVQAANSNGESGWSAIWSFTTGSATNALPMRRNAGKFVFDAGDGGREIRYLLPGISKVRLNIYDFKGALVKRVVDAEQNEGEYSLTMPGLPNGTYFFTFIAGSFRHNGKIEIIR
jgi:hypothetical protein